MRGDYQAADPGNIEMTLSLTMSVHDWKKVRSAIGEKRQAGGPFWAMWQRVEEMIVAVEQKHWMRSEDME